VLFSPADLADVALWQRVQQSIGWRPADPRAAQDEFDELMRHRMIRRLIGILVTDCVNATSARLEAAQVRSTGDLQALPGNVCALGDELRAEASGLKRFLYERMYRHYRLVRMQSKAEHLLGRLFEAYAAEPAMLPPTARERLGDQELHRVVCDYIAGMTDRFALDEHEKLFPHAV
jgi:dGTPase